MAFRAKRETRGGLAKSKGYNIYTFSFIKDTDFWQVNMLARQTRHLFGKHFVHFVILNFESAMDEMLHYEGKATLKHFFNNPP